MKRFHDGDDLASASERLLEALTAPGRSSRVAFVSGPPCAGKSRVLESAQAELPEAALIDCAGSSANDVAIRIVEACGVRRPHAASKESFAALAKRVRGNHTVLLRNVQWAGILRTSDEPGRIIRAAARLGRATRARIRIGLEILDSQGDRAGDQPNVIRLNQHDVGFGPSGTPTAEIQALAMAEYPVVPLTAWSALCSAAGLTVSEAELQELHLRQPDLLTWTTDDPVGPGVAFTHEGRAALWRSAHAGAAEASAFFWRSMRDRLLPQEHPQGWREGSPLARYAARSVPGHAAASGSLDELLQDRHTLALLDPASVMEACRHCYRREIDPDSPAAQLRYFELAAMEPMCQGEWAAWLHHAAVVREDTAAAQAVVESSVTMPWRTEWSDLRPVGVFFEEDARVRASGVTSIRAGDDSVTATNDFLGREWTWALPAGVPRAAPIGGRTSSAQSRRMCNTSTGWRPDRGEPDGVPMPRMPREFHTGVRVADTAVLAGKRGAFAVRILNEAVMPESAPWHGAPLLDPYERSIVARPLPESLRLVDSERLAGLFGFDHLFRPDDSGIPDTLQHVGTRLWLVEQGFPTVDFMTLDTTNLPDNGLVPSAPDMASEMGAPPPGPFLHLGTLLGEELIVDGTSGRVLCVSDEAPARCAGTSLGQFVTMFWLTARHHLLLSESLTIDALEARAELDSWIHEIDPEAASGEVWDTLLNDPEIESGSPPR